MTTSTRRPWSEDAKKRQAERLREYYATHKHPMEGKQQPPEWIENARRRRWPPLEDLPKVELVKRAQLRGIVGAARMTKALLIAALKPREEVDATEADDQGPTEERE